MVNLSCLLGRHKPVKYLKVADQRNYKYQGPKTIVTAECIRCGKKITVTLKGYWQVDSEGNLIPD